MYCRKCGKQLNDDAKFCPYCGTEIAEHGEVPKKEKKKTPTKRIRKHKPLITKKWKRIIVATILVAIIAVISVGVFGYKVVPITEKNYTEYLYVRIVNPNIKAYTPLTLTITTRNSDYIFKNVKFTTRGYYRNMTEHYTETLPAHGNGTFYNVYLFPDDIGKPNLSEISGYVIIPRR